MRIAAAIALAALIALPALAGQDLNMNGADDMNMSLEGDMNMSFEGDMNMMDAASNAMDAASNSTGPMVFTAEHFARLRFLEGRWEGRYSDGSRFWAEYDFPSPTRMRERVYDAPGFGRPDHEASVALAGDAIEASAGANRWRAAELYDGYVSFMPTTQTHAFSWADQGDGRVTIVQNWLDEDGFDQSLTFQMRRMTAR